MNARQMTKVRPNDPKYVGVYIRTSPDTGIETFYISYKDKETGRKLWEKVGKVADGFTKSQARELRSKRVLLGKPKKVIEPITMNQAFKHWCVWAEVNLGSDLTPEISRYRVHLGPTLGKKLLKDIEPVDIEMIKGRLYTNPEVGLPSTRQILVLLKRIYNRMIALRLYDGRNPMDDVVIPRAKNKRVRFLSRAQSQEIMDTLEESNRMAWAMAGFALYAGLRKSEILKLTPEDIDMVHRVITVYRVKHASDKCKIRSVPIQPRLANIAARFLENAAPGEPLFTYWPSKIFNTIFKPYNEGIDVKDKARWISFHTLRHTFASLLVSEGVHLKVVQELMGHDTIQATEIYAKVAPDDKRAAIEKMGRMWE